MHQRVYEQIDHLKTLYSAFEYEVLCTYDWADWPSESTMVLVNWEMHQGALFYSGVLVNEQTGR